MLAPAPQRTHENQASREIRPEQRLGQHFERREYLDGRVQETKLFDVGLMRRAELELPLFDVDEEP